MYMCVHVYMCIVEGLTFVHEPTVGQGLEGCKAPKSGVCRPQGLIYHGFWLKGLNDRVLGP